MSGGYLRDDLGPIEFQQKDRAGVLGHAEEMKSTEVEKS
jgi:hypothetical protein